MDPGIGGVLELVQHQEPPWILVDELLSLFDGAVHALILRREFE